MALLSACEEGDLFKVRQLIKEGCDVNTRGEHGTTPLIVAAIGGHNQVVEELIRKGARVNVKSNTQRTALWYASCNGHCSVVKTLCAAGADTNVQDQWGLTPLMCAAWRGRDEIVCELIRAGASVNVVTSSEGLGVAAGSTALHFAADKNCSAVKRLCAAGADTNVQNQEGVTPLMRAVKRGSDEIVCELIRAGASVNVQYQEGHTPLMWAAEKGSDEIVCELIRAGASVNVVTSSEWWEGLAAGSTALHYAAACNHIKCGVLLVEAGADMTVRNKESKSPLDLASGNFQQTIRQAQSFSTKRIVAVIGNAEHGKSTLIAALQVEGKNIFMRFVNKFTQVQDIRQRTAGIEAIQFSSRKYGQTLFYDFAGQADYHGPHQSFLEAILSKPGVSVTLLLLVKVTDEEGIITQQITRWLQPLALTSAPSTPQVILVGSFLDRVKSKEEAAEKLLRCTQSVHELPFNIQGPCLLDCRKPESEGINQICTLFQEAQPLWLNSDSLSYNLRWVLVQVQKAFSVPAITLHTFQAWLLANAELLSRNLPPAVEVCRDLTAVGHALFLPNKLDPSQSWLILDLQAVLHNVYGTLFSESQGKVNQFGLLHCSQLAELFPKLDPTMTQQVLISLNFCIQVDSRILREDLVKLTAGTEGEGWLYFPALVSAQPSDIFPKDADPHHLQWVCWQLRTEEKHLISAHLLQSIILRLAANHVFTHKLSSARQHCCTVWINGLSWMSITGVEVAVQISDSSVVQVVGRSKAGPDRLSQYVSTIVRDVIKTTTQLSPKLKATSYIVHPYTPAMWEDTKAPPPDSLFPVLSIIRCISDGGDHVPSLKQVSRLPMCLTELFGGWSPSLSVVQDMEYQTEPESGECVFLSL